MDNILYLAPAAGIASLIFAGIFASLVLKQSTGTKEMQEIASAIQEGAMAYLNRQYKTVAVVVMVLAAAILILLDDGAKIAVGFIAGAIASAAAGYIGMNVSVRANVRTANAAKDGIEKALSIAFKGGAVTGLAVVGLALLGTSSFYILFGAVPENVHLVVGFAFGASLISLFARVGDGIAEMATLPSSTREVTDKLDAVGNTTKAVTKGYAIGSAALGALALFADYRYRVGLVDAGTLGLNNPVVLVGLLMALFMANSGAAWDNAKKLIEDGAYGGKGSEAHRAAVVGDTVGDPFKDTSGPALNPLIKVVYIIAILFAGLLGGG